ncbi:transcription termination factor MTERF2, chloroplastic isoform X4 [Cryptomeria japonica]|uniref:transcription termination factor MTERF2, chloroplastic isoform X4 n=1 Tax=Cryptomeria japonica TaxID=3369 RepID=UPI0025ACECC3|nr:transcription termination factor MTERF2, chloroplastic isoform X4 [Cryptomeria japonica]
MQGLQSVQSAFCKRFLYLDEGSRRVGNSLSKTILATRIMAISGRYTSSSIIHILGYDRRFKKCVPLIDCSRAESKDTHLQTSASSCCPLSVTVRANLSANSKALKFSVAPYSGLRGWCCASDNAMDSAPTDKMQEAFDAVTVLLQELGISKADAMIISRNAPSYTHELMDVVHELDELALWGSWETEIGGVGVEHLTFSDKILKIARRKRGAGFIPYLESIGVNPSSTLHISRYLLGETLPGLIEKMEARLGGLAILDSGGDVLARLIESFPKILLRDVNDHMNLLIDFFISIGVPKCYAGLVILCYPPVILFDIEADIQPRMRLLEKAGMQRKELGKMLLKYPWLLSKCIQDNISDVISFFIAAKVPKRNVDKAIKKCPQLLGCSIETFKLIVNQMNSLNIKGKTVARVVSSSPHLFLRRPREFSEVVFFMKELGLDTESLGRILNRCPEIYASNVENTLRRKVNFLIETYGLRDNRLLLVMQKYPEVLALNVEQTVKLRLEYLESVGFSKENVAFMVSGFPPLLGYSIEEVLKPKLEFLVNAMGRSIKEIVTYPRYFSYSLEKKIKPRFRILHNRKIQCDLKTMLSKSDDVFAEEFLGIGRMLVPPMDYI